MKVPAFEDAKFPVFSGVGTGVTILEFSAFYDVYYGIFVVVCERSKITCSWFVWIDFRHLCVASLENLSSDISFYAAATRSTRFAGWCSSRLLRLLAALNGVPGAATRCRRIYISFGFIIDYLQILYETIDVIEWTEPP